MRKEKKAEERRESVLKSMERKATGGITAFAAHDMAAQMGGDQAVCTITNYCRTFVYVFPGSHLTSDAQDSINTICDTEICKAAIVTDPFAYFEEDHGKFQHYKIDVSLQQGIRRISEQQAAEPQQETTPIFLIVEQYESVPSTAIGTGQCFLIDECRNGKQIIEGGREGEKALLAIRILGGVWPEFAARMDAVNAVLASVKAEQDVTHYFEPLYSCSCYVSDDNHAIYTIHPTMSIHYGGARTTSPIDITGLREKSGRISLIHEGLRGDSETRPQIAELVDSVLWDKDTNEAQFRLWYLRLWQALCDAKRLLGEPKLEHQSYIVAGKLTTAELKEYRHAIAHWWTGKIDYSYVTDIQKTAMKLLRNRYRMTSSEAD